MSEQQTSYEPSEEEKNELIATRVMGWHLQEFHEEHKTAMDENGYRDFYEVFCVWWCQANKTETMRKTDWHPERDDSQAMMVAERLRERGYNVMAILLARRHWITGEQLGGGYYQCQVTAKTEETRRVMWRANHENPDMMVEANSVALAIRNAAYAVALAMEEGKS